MAKVDRILIVKLSAIGDCLHATPALEALRSGYPNAQIDWLVHDHCAPVLQGNPFLNEVLMWSRKTMFGDFLKIVKQLRKRRYDIAIDQQGLLKSAVVARLSGARKVFGPSEGRELSPIFYHHKLTNHADEHVVRHYLLRAKEAGATWEEEPEMLFPIKRSDEEFVDQFLSELGWNGQTKLVVLNPSAGKEFKQWPPDRFGRLGRKIMESGDFQALVTGAPADRDLADAVMVAGGENIWNLCGRTNLHQLAALFSRCELFIGGDTGPMHIAQAAGLRVLAMFGPTNPARLGPRKPQHRTIYHPGPMEQISEEEVWQMTREMLGLQK